MRTIPKPLLLALLAIAAFGGYLRFVAMTETAVDRPFRADAGEYYLSAYNLAKHGVYGRSDAALRQPPGTPVADSYRWPGLPLVIAAFMDRWPDHAAILRRVQWVNLATGTAAVLLVGLAASASALPAWAAAAAALLAAVSPHLISFGVYLLTEPPATFLIALILALCALGPSAAPPPAAGRRPAWAWAGAIGIAVGLVALFRPIFLLLPLFLALAFVSFRPRKALIVALALGTALPVAPWLIRNAVSVEPGTGPSLTAGALISGAYPGYLFNADSRTFPYPYAYDPVAKVAAANVGAAISEVAKRIEADPIRMAKWYLLEKSRYLWQFDNVDGAGGVLVYPVRQTPFRSDPLLAAAHEAMRWLHWPLVATAFLGAILVWLPRAARYLPDASLVPLRAGSLLLAFVTAAHFPLWVATRMAVPVFPAVFLLAPVPIVIGIRVLQERRGESADG